MQIPKDVIDRVRDAHDIVDVVGRTIPLKKLGRAWKALCPFHDEKTPSFTVNHERQTFKCFGCGKGGDVFVWLMEREGLAFPEAVRALAAERGIEVPSMGGRRDGAGASRLEAIRKAIALAQELYVRTLWEPGGFEARAYLAKRGFPDPAVRALGLGLSPPGWDGLLSLAASKGLTGEVVEDAGLAIRRDGKEGRYDRFRGRLMFPVADVQGRIVTWGARAMRPDDQPKYLNGPETPVFRKSRTLYGLDRARETIRSSGTAVLMEGYTDVLMAHMHGVTQAVAGMGTAFTEEQANALKRQDAHRVVLLYDGDQAGRLAAEKSLDILLEHGFEVRIALLPEGKDVDEVLLEEGVERLQSILDGALDLFDFKLGQMAATDDLSTPRGKALAADRLLDSIRRVPHEIERDLLLRRTAERVGVAVSVLLDRVRDLAHRDRRPGRREAVPGAPVSFGALGSAGGSGSGGGTPASDMRARLKSRDRRLEQECLIAGAVFRPEWFREVRDDLTPGEVEDPGLLTIWRIALSLADEGTPPTPDAVGRAVVGDPEASAAFAGLPEDLPFEDWIPEALRQRRHRRAEEQRREALRHLLAGSVLSTQDVPPGGLPPTATEEPRTE
jgi:DNA primase